MDQPGVFNIQTLQNISFNRSKLWGEFLNTFSTTSKKTKELHFDDMDKFYSEIDEEGDYEGDDLDDFEDVLQDLTNRSSMSFRTPPRERSDQPPEKHPYTLSLLPCAVEAISSDEDEDECSMQDLLNQTKPLLAEHNRRWKEAGIERILNTFDPEKIEEKVGGWIRRNNSVCTDTSISPLSGSGLSNPVRLSKRQSHFSHVKQMHSESETESMHSVDTARYILSSRKRHAMQQRVSSSCTTTTIKTFRLVQSKRDELREKYRYDDSGEEARLTEIRRRRARAHLHCQQKASDVAAAVSGLSAENRQYRQKQLRMRRSRSDNATLLSTDEDDDFQSDRDTIKRGQSYRRVSKQRRNSVRVARCMPHCHLSFSSSSSSSFTRHLKPSGRDLRPCKRESECPCWNQKKLCESIKHLAETSTEDWVVDNCDTPKKQTHKEAVKNRHDIAAAENSKKIRFQNKEDAKNRDEKTTSKHLEENQVYKQENRKKPSQKLADDCPDSLKDNGTNHIIKPNSAGIRQKKDAKTQQSVEEHSDSEELKIAIELSKLEFEAEERRRKALDKANGKPPKTAERKEKSVKILEANSKTLQKRTVRSLEASSRRVVPVLKAEESEQLPSSAASRAPTRLDETVIAEKSLKPQPKSAKLRKLAKMSIGGEETFFAHAKNICNSTAFAEDEAAKRQFEAASAGNPNEVTKARQLQAVASKSETTAKPSKTSKGNGNDSDCTHVSSTTDVGRRPQTASAKSILLYTPDDKFVAPAHSYHGGGFRITEEHLSAVLGAKAARQFLKYYIGRRVFDGTSAVYYRPPATGTTASSATCATDSDSDSDLDVLDGIGEYGELYELKDKPDH